MWWSAFRSAVISLAAFVGALGVIIGGWVSIGGPIPAWSTDIRKLNSSQAEIAIDVYTKAIRDDTILRSQISDPVTKALVDQRIEEFRAKWENAQKRKIELAK